MAALSAGCPMHRVGMWIALVIVLLGPGRAGFVTLAHPPQLMTHSGMASASAVVAVDSDHFLAASDEDNRIRLYSTLGGAALTELDVSPWLGLSGRRGEVDLEGAATLNGLTYWLGSHGRAKDGRARPDRERLFATRLVTNGSAGSLGALKVQFVGVPYRHLLEDLIQAPQLARFHLRAAATKLPGEGGINLEGLAAGPAGELIIGFRSPVPDGRALLVPLKNPAAMVEGRAAKLGDPILLDLGDLGVRDLAWSGREWFVIAGRMGGGGTARLFRWVPGSESPARVEHSGFKHVNPEAVTVFGTPESPSLLILSDDGKRSQAEFRSFWLVP